MFTFKPFMGATILLLLLAACHQHESEKQTVTSDQEYKSTMTPVDRATDKASSLEKEIPVINDQQPVSADTIIGTAKQSSPPPATTKTAASVIVEDYSKKIIKNASVKLEVKDFKTFNDNLSPKLKQYGAYIAQEDNNITEEKSEAVLSIKVPVQYFDDLMAALPNADTKTLEKSIRTEDVTGAIVDTRSRLEAKKQMRLKYLDFLKESKNMTEVLQVQDEINGIQEEIESAAGRYASLTTQSAYSTINLTYFKTNSGYKEPDEKPGFFSKISEAFSTGASWLSNLFVGLMSVWPLVLATCAGLYIYKKRKPAKVSQQNV